MLIIFFLFMDTTKVWWKADYLFYDKERERILLIGDAEINTESVKVCAETILYLPDTGFIIAYGNAVLYSGENVIKSCEMAYDIKTGKGISLSSEMKVFRGWAWGREAYKIGKKEYAIEDVEFTTCSEIKPHYYFKAKEARVYLDDMLFARPVILVIKGISSFWVPFWYFPITKKRKSGFLYPKIGIDMLRGRFVRDVSYYLVINDYSDVTFTLNLQQKLEPQFCIEFIYLVKPWITGRAFSTFVYKKIDKKLRWSINYVNNYTWASKNLSIKADVDMASDLAYRKEYADSLTPIETEGKITLSISKSWRFGTAGITFQEKRNLSENTFRRFLPKVSIGWKIPQIWGINLSYNTLFLNYYENAFHKSALDNNFSLSKDYKIFKYFIFTPSVTFRATQFDEVSGKKFPLFYSYGIRGGLSTTLYGRTIFKPEFRHILMPSLSFSYNNVKGDSFPVFGGLASHPEKGKFLNFGIKNEFKLKLKKEINLFDFNISSGWNFEKNKFKDFNFSLTSRFSSLVKFSASFKYFVEQDSFSITSYSFSIEHKNLRYSYSRASHQIGFYFKKALTKTISIEFRRSYDLREKNKISESISLKKDLHCWEFSVSYQQMGTNWRYDFEAHIKAIPEIKVNRGFVQFLIAD